ncbi:hypothetical protein ACVBIL_17830 [Shewanella sp. 125m-7]
MRFLFAIGFIASIFCPPTWAEHIVGGNIGIGFQDFESISGEDVGMSDNISTDLFYRYMMSEHFGIEAAIFAGTGGMLNTLTGALFDVKDMRYTGVRGAIYSQVYLSNSNKLFAKLGVRSRI